jgi:hypothetical protein
MKTYGGVDKYTILDLATRCRLVVIFTPQLIYPRGEGLRYTLCGKLGGLRTCLEAMEQRKIGDL